MKKSTTGYSSLNAGSLSENNAAMTELWQSRTEQLISNRRWDEELDWDALSADVQDLASAILGIACHTSWDMMPRVSADIEFEICMIMGKAIRRALLFSHLDNYVKHVIKSTFDKEYDLRTNGGQRRFFRVYLNYKRSK